MFCKLQLKSVLTVASSFSLGHFHEKTQAGQSVFECLNDIDVQCTLRSRNGCVDRQGDGRRTWEEEEPRKEGGLRLEFSRQAEKPAIPLFNISILVL